MPYIDDRDKERAATDPLTEGELNYALTRLCLGYVERYGGPAYALFNDVVGALECCKLEMYRRAVVPYENKKMEVNGDVYA